MRPTPNVQIGRKAPYYIHLPVKSANDITFSKIVVWCNKNGYNLSYHSSGMVNGGWHVRNEDVTNKDHWGSYVTIGFESLTDEQKFLLELRWAGQ